MATGSWEFIQTNIFFFYPFYDCFLFQKSKRLPSRDVEICIEPLGLFASARWTSVIHPSSKRWDDASSSAVSQHGTRRDAPVSLYTQTTVCVNKSLSCVCVCVWPIISEIRYKSTNKRRRCRAVCDNVQKSSLGQMRSSLFF